MADGNEPETHTQRAGAAGWPSLYWSFIRNAQSRVRSGTWFSPLWTALCASSVYAGGPPR